MTEMLEGPEFDRRIAESPIHQWANRRISPGEMMQPHVGVEAYCREAGIVHPALIHVVHVAALIRGEIETPFLVRDDADRVVGSMREQFRLLAAYYDIPSDALHVARQVYTVMEREWAFSISPLHAWALNQLENPIMMIMQEQRLVPELQPTFHMLLMLRGQLGKMLSSSDRQLYRRESESLVRSVLAAAGVRDNKAVQNGLVKLRRMVKVVADQWMAENN